MSCPLTVGTGKSYSPAMSCPLPASDAEEGVGDGCGVRGGRPGAADPGADRVRPGDPGTDGAGRARADRVAVGDRPGCGAAVHADPPDRQGLTGGGVVTGDTSDRGGRGAGDGAVNVDQLPACDGRGRGDGDGVTFVELRQVL